MARAAPQAGARRRRRGADGHPDGVGAGPAVVFVEAAVPEQGFTGTASEQWRAHVAGALEVVRIDCAHSELLDPQVIGRWFPAIAHVLTDPEVH